MQRTWRRVGKRLSEICLLCALPAVAFAWYSPHACGMLTTGLPHVAAPVAAGSTAPRDAAAVLREWTDTQTTNPITINLVVQARQESLVLNAAVRNLRQQLAGQKVGTLAYNLIFQSLQLTAAERDAWDSNWRLIGRPHADQTVVQNTLITLQVKFVNANTTLVPIQAQQISSGSTSTFTPPSFL
jgi:hypothetical protein